MIICVIDNGKDEGENIPYLNSLKRILSGKANVEVLRYSELERRHFWAYDGFILTGSDNHVAQSLPNYAREVELVKLSNAPILGICFGHQLLCHSFGANVAGMGKKLKGYFPVEVKLAEPLFEGLGERIIVREEHIDKVEEVPAGFKLAASSEHCLVEAVVHESRPLFGVQFHPEKATPKLRDGRRVLLNFLGTIKR